MRILSTENSRQLGVLKKFTAGAMCAVTLLGSVSAVNAASYDLRYVKDAPSNLFNQSTAIDIKANGKQSSVVVKSKTFDVSKKSAMLLVAACFTDGKNRYYSSSATIASATDKSTLIFKNGVKPKKNIKVRTALKLVDYEKSKSVHATGTVNLK